MKTKILIADDHAVLRSGLRMLIDSQPDMEVVGEAANVTETVEKARAMNPDVLLLDVAMPKHDGLSAVPAVQKACPRTRILVLTMHDDPSYLRSALAAGAVGYVVKAAADTELLTAIRSVASGRTFVDISSAAGLAQDIVNGNRARAPASQSSSMPELSEREREVLAMVALGHTNQEVADRLKVSIKSVETYRARLMEKLSLKTRAELVRYALEHDLLTPDSGTR